MSEDRERRRSPGERSTQNRLRLSKTNLRTRRRGMKTEPCSKPTACWRRRVGVSVAGVCSSSTANPCSPTRIRIRTGQSTNKGRTRLVVPAPRQARGVYATARPLLRPAAHEDTLNLGPSKIEADPQPVLAGRPGYVLPVSLRIASIMMPVERWTSRQTIFRSIPSCAPSNGKTNMSPIRIIRP